MDNLPNQFSKSTIDKKNTLEIPLSHKNHISYSLSNFFSQIIFGKYHISTEEPHENSNL
jgi:hypothetical protein